MGPGWNRLEERCPDYVLFVLESTFLVYPPRGLSQDTFLRAKLCPLGDAFLYAHLIKLRQEEDDQTVGPLDTERGTCSSSRTYLSQWRAQQGLKHVAKQANIVSKLGELTLLGE